MHAILSFIKSTCRAEYMRTSVETFPRWKKFANNMLREPDAAADGSQTPHASFEASYENRYSLLNKITTWHFALWNPVERLFLYGWYPPERS